ncbi:MAG: COX15/CtaA family protein [Alphaproteobacteria bacterium]|nr:COX15/CtaA family protein [Alphaproteobacteria bacterium]
MNSDNTYIPNNDKALTLSNSTPVSRDRICANWLIICATFVFLMAVIGAVTRLTESGLSMTTWKPVTGAIPPLTHDAWLDEFASYQKSPEFLKKNAGMTLDDFKNIFFWEWLHRLWGRLIGLIVAVPLFFFWLTGRVADGYGKKFLGLLALGGLQGAVGWWMVKSGLIDNPAVSHYRLATHLGLAVFIYACMVWMALTLLRRDGTLLMRPVTTTHCLRRHGRWALAFVAITMVWGAFVAGLDAGLIYNEWPLMGGRFIPSDMWAATPAWLNVFETHAAVQFTHRWLAFTAFVLTLGFAWRTGSPILATAIVLQFCLGILTLLSHVALPLAALHQAGALFTLTALLYQLHRVLLGAPGRG